MPTFIVNRNTQSSGDNEVHNTTTGCKEMPAVENQINLGAHLSCHDAVAYAKQQLRNSRINGCFYCCNSCHTS